MSSLLNSVRHCLPGNWENRSSSEVQMVELGPYSSEYVRVTSKMGSLTPKRIVSIQNPHMWGCYQLRKAECSVRYPGVEEKELWHATSPSNIESIATDNFNWRLTSRAKFGQGVCFAPTATYAHSYSSTRGALILTKVLVGRTSFGSYGTTIPASDCDTTLGSFGGNAVYVKYMDHDFYPEYVAYYS